MEEQNDYAKFNEAMAKFQEEYEPPKKDKKVDYTTKKGQRIKYEYSDLESLQKAIRTTASKHGLSWNIDFEYKETSIVSYGKEQKALMIIPIVVINHSSGAEKRFRGIPLFATDTDPQGIGSIKTYSERYALGGAFGIASDADDDGQIAADRNNNQQQYNQQNNQQTNPPRNNFEDNKKEVQERLRQVAKKTDSKYQDLIKYVFKVVGDKMGESQTEINSRNIAQFIGIVKGLELKANKRERSESQQGSLMEGNTTTAKENN